ncbi:hypothetical protein [Veronia pacifica]|uniref:ABC transporter domain-containing protein n=1 Tax=Veronia pacifica TaxID=1080227 RepID=A0A1C3EAF3_9GAMM|nr:hypothetical protein [Veronia pacifica]ODA30225.1 hypothetical protein A8L45_20700 [Veronia pacifica]
MTLFRQQAVDAQHQRSYGSVSVSQPISLHLLARALYQQPNILYMDEATSSLDVANETRIREKIELLDITKVVIAHRLEKIKQAGRIVKMEKGQITEYRDNTNWRSLDDE